MSSDFTFLNIYYVLSIYYAFSEYTYTLVALYTFFCKPRRVFRMSVVRIILCAHFDYLERKG